MPLSIRNVTNAGGEVRRIPYWRSRRVIYLEGMNWKTIRLELAGTRAFPSGSVSRGYLLRLPLDDQGSVDEAALAKCPQRATVRRFWSSEPDEQGRLMRVDGTWSLRCNGKPGRILTTRASAFEVGEKVEIASADGTRLPFKVAGIVRVL